MGSWCQTKCWRCGCTRTEISPYLLNCFVQRWTSPSAWAERDRRDGEECSIFNCFLWTGDLHHWDNSCMWEFKSTSFPTLWLVFALQREASAACHWISCCSCYPTEGPAACPHPGATSSSWRSWCYASLWEGCRGNTRRYEEAIHLAQAAGMIWHDMLQHKSQFNSTCLDGCLEDAVP